MCGAKCRGYLGALLASSLVLGSCYRPEAIAKFSSAAAATLKGGDDVFEDLGDSCLRAMAATMPLTSFEPDPLSTPPGRLQTLQSAACDVYKKQAEGLEAANKVLRGYFAAMNQLASFDNAKLAQNTGDLTQNAAANAPLKSTELAALTGLGGILVGVLTAGYQEKHLGADIKKADPEIQTVTSALKTVIRNNYMLRLNDEQSKLSQRYQRLLRDYPCPSDRQGGEPAHACHLEAIVMAQERWKQDLQALDAKRRVAEEFISGLETIAEGHKALAENSEQLKSKRLSPLLAPYTSELQDFQAEGAKP